MHRVLLVGVGWAASGCGLGRCESLCVESAECLDAEIVSFDESWSEWTGFPDRESWEDACFAVFEEAQDNGAAGSDLRKTCRAEPAPCSVTP